MSAIEIVLLVLVALLYLKWIVMAISFPFMCANNKRRVLTYEFSGKACRLY